MTAKEELARINAEVLKEVREFDDMNRALKKKKQRMYKLYEEQARWWKKIIGQVKYEMK